MQNCTYQHKQWFTWNLEFSIRNQAFSIRVCFLYKQWNIFLQKLKLHIDKAKKKQSRITQFCRILLSSLCKSAVFLDKLYIWTIGSFLNSDKIFALRSSGSWLANSICIGLIITDRLQVILQFTIIRFRIVL